MSPNPIATPAAQQQPVPGHFLSSLGLWKEQRVRRPTWRGYLLLVFLAGLSGWFVLRFAHPFFAVNERIEAPVLVVEGWGVDYMMAIAAAEATNGGYQHIYVTGGPMERFSGLPGFTTYAEVGYEMLKQLGVPTAKMTAVPSEERYRNRTFSSAVALRNYTQAQGVPLTRINLLTLGSHARRSRLCFQRALGKDVEVGIIAVKPLEYDPERWWRFSGGVKSVISESIGLPYAWLTLDYGD